MATTLTNDSIDQFLASLHATGMSNETIRAYKADLNEFKKFLLSTGSYLSPAHSDDWVETQACLWLTSMALMTTTAPTAPKSAATIRRRKACLSRWATSMGVPGMLNKYKLPPQTTPKPHPIPTGKTGLEKMIEACGDDAKGKRNAALIALCGYAGMRVSSARELTGDQIDFTEHTIKFTGKGRKENIVYLSERARELLYAHLDATAKTYPVNNRVFPDLSDRHTRAMITRIGERAGLGHVKSHDLRATFATEAYAASHDIRAVQMLLGHSTVMQTQTYVDVAPKKLRQVASF